MQQLTTGSGLNYRSWSKPLAVLSYNRGDAVTEELPRQVNERMERTSFGSVNRFQSGKISCTVLKLQGADSQHAVLVDDREDVVYLGYMLEGISNWHIDDVQALTLRPGEYHCIFFPKGSVGLVEFATRGEVTLVIVGMEQRYFSSYLPPSDVSLGLKGGVNSYMADLKPLHITPDQFAILYDVINCKRKPFIRHHYLLAKFNELLLLHLEQSVHYSMKSQSADLREDELQRVYKVRDMLSREPSKSYSLIGLAHAVGTNDATLKRQFKQVFGTTVFAYLTSCRMELAKTLLLKNNQKVAVVAQEVGYKYASHFSTAFRKYFGYLPNKLLRSMAPFSFLIEVPIPVFLL